jgi:hypothetical protein
LERHVDLLLMDDRKARNEAGDVGLHCGSLARCALPRRCSGTPRASSPRARPPSWRG